MKKVKTVLLVAMSIFFLISACEKEMNHPDIIAKGNTEAPDFIYNTLSKSFSPDADVNGKISVGKGIKLIYYYLVRNGLPDIMIYSDAKDINNLNQFSFTIPGSAFKKLDMTQVTGLKVVAKLVDNSTYEGFVKITSFSPSVPELSGFPESFVPDRSKINPSKITGKIKSESGLAKVIIEDDSQGGYTEVATINNLNGVKDYNFNYDYTFRTNATHVKIKAVDIFGLTAEYVILMTAAQSDFWEHLIMEGQGAKDNAGTHSFFMSNASSSTACEVIGDKQKELLFLIYIASNPQLKLYGPHNTGSIAGNYYCGAGAPWARNASMMNTTKFKALKQDDAKEGLIYNLYNAGDIKEVNQAFFGDIALPGSSAPGFVDSESGVGGSTFNSTNASLIWIRTEYTNGTVKNALMKVNKVEMNTIEPKLSTIDFDIILEK